MFTVKEFCFSLCLNDVFHNENQSPLDAKRNIKVLPKRSKFCLLYAFWIVNIRVATYFYDVASAISVNQCKCGKNKHY